MNKKYYITTPIYYPSANFHIGHCYTTIIADSLARYKRLDGYEVLFQTGTDEHGEKIENKAKEAGITPKMYVDEVVSNAIDLWKSLNISYDKFIRTTDKLHEQTVSKIFTKLYEQDDIYKGEYKGLYCTPCESFWTPSQAKDNLCPDCGRELKEVSEEAYFLRLSKYQDRLLEYINSHPDFIEPISRKNEMINNFIKPGLEDLCVSRTSFKWGIPVSFDQNHVIYVWIDALSNYITSLGYLTNNDEEFQKFWPADLHLVGKEIVRFHTIIWPIILMALDLPLPHQVFGHGWLIVNGKKLSKSLGNYKDPREYINKYGVDAIRYFCLREVPFGNDGNFSEESLILRTNADLANVLGNLVNRTIGMAEKYFDGIITNTKVKEDIDEKLIDLAISTKQKVDKNMSELHIADALDNIFEIFRQSNKYIDETTPWALAKDPEKNDRLATVIYNLIESIRFGTVLLQAFLPETSAKIFAQINTDACSFNTLDKFGYYKENTKLGKKEVLFARIEEE